MPDRTEALTCPHCGALVTRDLTSCRQCKKYLHGTALEGWLTSLLPERFAQCPATGAFVVLNVVFYAFMVLATGGKDWVGFSAFTLRSLGGLHGPDLLLGEYWRLMTYMVGHHDLVHLGFNLSALMAAGPVVERLLNRQKMTVLYLVAGVLGGVASGVYYIALKGGPELTFVSSGASGSVSGLIGAALVAAWRVGFDEREEKSRMLRWSVGLAIWGVAMPGINNAAHLGGWLGGALCALAFPLGSPKPGPARTTLSVVAMAGLLGLVGCVGWMFYQGRGNPARLEDDGAPRAIMGVRYYKPTPWERSSQFTLSMECVNPTSMLEPLPEQLRKCALAVQALPTFGAAWRRYAGLLEANGQRERARVALEIATRVSTEPRRAVDAQLP